MDSVTISQINALNFDEWNLIQDENLLDEKIKELSRIIEWFSTQHALSNEPEEYDVLKRKIITISFSGKIEEKITALYNKLGEAEEYNILLKKVKYRLKHFEATKEQIEGLTQQLKYFATYYKNSKLQDNKDSIKLYQIIQRLSCESEVKTNLTTLILNMWKKPTELQNFIIKRVALDLHCKLEDPIHRDLADQFIEMWEKFAQQYTEKQLSNEEWQLICEELYQTNFSEEDAQKIYRSAPVDITELKYQRWCVQYRKTSTLFVCVKLALQSLAQDYSQHRLTKSRWDEICIQILDSSMPSDKKEELLDIFRDTEKISPGFMERIYSGVSTILSISNYWSDAVDDGEPLWKGDKYLIFLKSLKNWLHNQNAFIQEKLGENQRNSATLKQKVLDLLSLIEKMELSSLKNKEPDLAKRKSYNEGLRELHKQYIEKLREALNEAQDDFKRYKTLGKERVSGCALILKELCDHQFTGINMVAFMLRLMKELIPLGLQELAMNETKYLIDLRKNPLKLPLSKQWEAIAALPQKYKAPLMDLYGWKFLNQIGTGWDPHAQGNIPFSVLKLTLLTEEGTKKEVSLQRFATPTNDNHVIPEFCTFLLGKRSFFASLQKKTTHSTSESRRTDALLSLNNEGGLSTFFTVNPLSQSALYNQKKEYADPSPNTPLYRTKESFFAALLEKIIPSRPGADLNAPGNYLFPTEWKSYVGFKTILTTCLNEVNEIFFPDVDVLKEKERRIFIKLFNVRLSIALMHFVKADIFAFLCNHSADRTGVMVGLLLKMLFVILNKENQPLYAEVGNSPTWSDLMTTIQAGPLVIAKRPLNFHEKGLEEALQVFNDKNVRQRLQDRRDSFGICDIEFPFSYIEEEWQANNQRQEIE